MLSNSKSSKIKVYVWKSFYKEGLDEDGKQFINNLDLLNITSRLSHAITGTTLSDTLTGAAK